MTPLKTPTNYQTSLFFLPLNQRLWEIARFILGWLDGEKQTIIPEAFPILESICGKRGGKGAQPLWVKGFRSRFNWLADIRTGRQKSWNGIWTRIHLLNDWHLRDWHWENEGRCLASQPAVLTYIFIPCMSVCVPLWGRGVFVLFYMLPCMQTFLFVCVGVYECTHACNCVCMFVVVYVPFILHGNVSLLVFRGA